MDPTAAPRPDLGEFGHADVEAGDQAIASFHLLRERRGRAVIAMLRLGLDRRRLAHTEGLLFWRLLGTGNGSQTARSIDPRRTAIFAVWHDAASADRFERTMEPRWTQLAEAYHVRMVAVGGHGSWKNFDVIAATRPPGGDLPPRAAHRAVHEAVAGEAPASVPPDGPIVVVTRAEVRLRHLRAFTRAAKAVSAQLPGTPGLLAVCGIGEAPIGRQATCSVWRSATDIDAFATGDDRHRQVMRRTRDQDWYGEEMFARFRPIASRGTWDGHDPLDVSPPSDRLSRRDT